MQGTDLRRQGIKQLDCPEAQVSAVVVAGPDEAAFRRADLLIEPAIVREKVLLFRFGQFEVSLCIGVMLVT